MTGAGPEAAGAGGVAPLGAPTDPLRPTGRVRTAGHPLDPQTQAEHAEVEPRESGRAVARPYDGAAKGVLLLMAVLLLVVLLTVLAFLDLFA